MSLRLQQLTQLLEATPDDPFLLFAVAKEHEKLDDANAALQWYQALQKKHPDYVGLYYHLGKLLEKANRTEEAIAAYRQGMQVARHAGDLHALSELNGACLEIDDSEDI